MNKLIFLLLFNFPFFVFGQETNIASFRGKLIDQDTGLPIPSAHIINESSQTATISNMEGDFEFKKKGSDSLSLKISHVSYELKEITVQFSYDSSTVKILLKPAVITLPDIVIDDNEARKLLSKVYDKLQVNKSKEYYAKGFYRQLSEDNKRYSALIEVFYDLKLTNQGIEGIHIDQGRFAHYPDLIGFTNFSIYTTSTAVHKDENKGTIKHPLSPNFNDYYSVSIQKYIKQGDREIAVIAVKLKEDSQDIDGLVGEIYVEKNSFNLIKLSLSLSKAELTRLKGENKSKFTYDVSKDFLSLDMNFKIYDDDISVLESCKIEYSIPIYKKNKEVGKLKAGSQFFVYQWLEKSPNVEYISPSTEYNDMKEIHAVKYNPYFWENNAVIARTPLEKKVIKTFEIEKYFEKNK